MINKFLGRIRHQHGGVIVTVCLCMLAMLAVLALAVDVFRMLTSRIQMQNFSEYGSELVLEQLRRGEFKASDPALDGTTMSQLQKVINENSLFGEATTSTPFGDSQICFNNPNCPLAVSILAGCYEIPRPPLTTPTPAFWYGVELCSSPAPGVDSFSAVYIKTRTGSSSRQFSLLFRGILGAFGGFSTNAFSYNENPAGKIFITGPFPESVSIDRKH